MEGAQFGGGGYAAVTECAHEKAKPFFPNLLLGTWQPPRLREPSALRSVWPMGNREQREDLPMSLRKY